MSSSSQVLIQIVLELDAAKMLVLMTLSISILSLLDLHWLKDLDTKFLREGGQEATGAVQLDGVVMVEVDVIVPVVNTLAAAASSFFFFLFLILLLSSPSGDSCHYCLSVLVHCYNSVKLDCSQVEHS